MAMRAKTNPETTVRIARILRAPIQRLFTAWTDPNTLKRWWGPAAGSSTHDLILESKIHGELHWVYSDSEHRLHTVNGEIRELVPLEKLAFTWLAVEGTPHFDLDEHDDPETRRRHLMAHAGDASHVHIDFREGRGVEIRILHADLPDRETRDALEAGWNEALDRLERVFTSA